MSNQELILQEIRLKEQGEERPNTLVVKISYDKGGMAMLTHAQQERGYSLQLGFCYDGDKMRRYKVGAGGWIGVKSFLKPAKRYSQRTIEALASDARNQHAAYSLAKELLAKRGYSLADDEIIALGQLQAA